MNDTDNPRVDKQERIDGLTVLSAIVRRSARKMEKERMEKNHEQNG